VAVESEGFETAVEFPGGRVENPVGISKDQLGKAAEARLGDARFVLDELGRRGWNLDKVGMFGHSFGGFTAAEPGSTGLMPVDGSPRNEEVPCDLR
jgi:dienelactone hydrolase